MRTADLEDVARGFSAANLDYAYVVGLSESDNPDALLMCDDLDILEGGRILHVDRPNPLLNHDGADGMNVVCVDGRPGWLANEGPDTEKTFPQSILDARAGQTSASGRKSKLID